MTKHEPSGSMARITSGRGQVRTPIRAQRAIQWRSRAPRRGWRLGRAELLDRAALTVDRPAAQPVTPPVAWYSITRRPPSGSGKSNTDWTGRSFKVAEQPRRRRAAAPARARRHRSARGRSTSRHASSSPPMKTWSSPSRAVATSSLLPPVVLEPYARLPVAIDVPGRRSEGGEGSCSRTSARECQRRRSDWS